MTEKVLDFIGKRKENIEQKRRNFERIVFDNFLGAYSVIHKDGVITPVSMVDISHDGCLFQVPWDMKKETPFGQGTEITLRMYFAKRSYIPVIVHVKYHREAIGKDGLTYMQYGAQFDTSMPTFNALKSFIDFMYKYAEHSSTDHGDYKAYFI